MATVGVAFTIAGALLLYWTWRTPLRLPGSSSSRPDPTLGTPGTRGESGFAPGAGAGQGVNPGGGGGSW